MARLPIPGSDNGTWGTLLNDYLAVAHDTSGTLKSNAVNSAAIQDNSVSGTKLQDDSVTNAKLLSGSGSNGQVLTKNSATSGGFEWATAASAADATTSSKGIVQLAGDLAGTAAAPTVPGLATKASTTTTISAGTGLTGGGDLSTNRTLSANFGTASGTIAQGNDSRITGAVQSTIVDAKGDLIVASAADTVIRVPVGSNDQVLTADSTQTSGVKWATPSASSSSSVVYPLSAYGFHSASDNIGNFRDPSTLDQAFFARIFVPAGKAIDALGALVRTAGTVGAGGLNGFAVYDDTGTLVTSTTDDNTMWQTTGWIIKVLGSPIAAQGSDRYIYAGVASRGYSSAPVTAYMVTAPGLLDGGGYLVTTRRAFYNSISSWPASFNPASYGLSTSGYLPLIALG